MEKAVASILICGIVIVVFAYQVGGRYFWLIHDAGQILFPIAFLIYVKSSLMMSTIGWVWFGGCFNALAVSAFGDVTKFDMGQKISLAILTMAVTARGIILAVRSYRHEQQRQQACKRNARKQYKDMRHRVDNIEKRIDRYDHTLEKFINDLITIQ